MTLFNMYLFSYHCSLFCNARLQKINLVHDTCWFDKQEGQRWFIKNFIRNFLKETVFTLIVLKFNDIHYTRILSASIYQLPASFHG